MNVMDNNQTEIQPEQNVEPIIQPTNSSTTALRGLLLLAILYTLYFAAALILPILTAVLLGLMLATPVRWLCQIGLPRSVAAITMVLTIIIVLGALVFSLAEPANTVITKSPQAITRIEKLVKELRKPLAKASIASEKISQLNVTEEPKDKTLLVRTIEPAIFDTWIQSLPMLTLNILGTLLLTVIFLTRGESILRKLVALAPQLNVKKSIVNASRSAQHELSRYMFTVALVNIVFGAVIALALWLLGVEQPFLWGGIAALVNFAPYVGMAIMVCLLTIAGFIQFDSVGMALAVPGIYIVLNAIESEIVTPLAVGKSMEIDPLVVILVLLVLGWMWGLVGLLIAVPLLTCFRIIAEKHPTMSVFARLISH
jgi:predicted PurR-regulated permease PerM